MEKQNREEPIQEQEFSNWDLKELGEIVLSNIKELFVGLNNNLDDTYVIDYNINLFEKIHQKYLRELQEVHKRRDELEWERTMEMIKLERRKAKKWKKK